MSEVGEWGDNREGEEKKAGRSSLAGQIHESLPRESKGGGDVNSPVKLESMLIPIQRQSPWSCWLVMNPVIVVQVL